MSSADDVGVFSDLELERQLLRYISATDSSLIPHIDINIFHGSDERAIFDVFKKLQTHFPEKSIPSILQKQLGGELYEEIEPTVKDMLKTPKLQTVKAAQVILKDLQDLYMQRSIIEHADAAIRFAEAEQVEDALDMLHIVLRAEARQKIDAGNYVDDYEEREATIKENAQKKGEEAVLIPTGIVQFDNIAGGIQKGEVGVVIGKTGGGKSTAKLNFSAHAYLSGFNVAFFGLEMSKKENEFRADSLLTEIPANYFRLASLTDNDYKTWAKKIKELRKSRKNFLEFIGAKGLTLSEILSVADGIENKQKKPIDLLIIDHLVLIKGDSKHKEFHMQQWDTFERLSEWAVRNQKAVWTSSQSTDEGVTRKKGMRVIDVKYSRAVAELANILIALYQSEVDEASGDLNFAVRKGRGMKSGDEIVLKPDFSRMILDTRSFTLHRMNQMDKAKGKRPKKKANRGRLG